MSKFETNVHNVSHRRRSKNPSFSSILLDAVYRSIDEDYHQHHNHSRTTPTSPTQSIKQSECKTEALKQRRTKMRSDSTLETVDLRRAIMIESWIDKNQHQQQQQQSQRKHFHLGDLLDQKIRIVRQKSAPSSRRTTTTITSDNDSSTTHNLSSSSSSCFTNLTPRSSSRDQSSSRIFTKTKSRALKIYGDLKKSKQQNTPISPGRKIAAFLNSIFRNSGNSPARSSPELKIPAISNSNCSSASSFSRSCLTNKTSSSEKSTPATKRSVRFYPVSVIVDEDSRPCGHKSLHKNENEESKKLASPLMDSTGTGEQMKWRREKEIDTLMMMINTNCGDNQRHVSRFHGDSDEEMEEEDDESCASSDLFELENFSSIGVSRYYEELPVYGTTSLKNLTV
ncbi:hypothetical protein BVRB_002180 [Beta vulgaris subsp. vulgaris]|uniref:Protein BIG GRAIN 1-like B n=1 Tax=Beta vulgaris subsp. vulgaris TaxID=3555 RepID=A0A0J8B562_BETVV|nr:protein BIG GRAIN 1-like A [Beta vulgaris subsp. vulgaris]KMS96106.1 hypothetical protein BVRB_002180 [Beta vulgaris subsp. vulgaris]